MTLLGDAKNATGDYDEAIENYARALAMNPNLAGVKDRIAVVERAKTALSAPDSTGIGETTVSITSNDNSSVEEETASPSPAGTSPNIPPTLSAPSPGFTAILLACAMGLFLASARKK
jgi:tetratricopeptide (TPR) repeat protein